MNERIAAVPYVNTMFALMAVAGLAALLFAAAAERRHFVRIGLGRGWWLLRLGMPLLFAVFGLFVVALARAQFGSEGLIMAYLGVYVVALPAWFVLHVVAGRLLRPRMSAGPALWLAASPLAAALMLTVIGHQLQPLAWSLAMALGRRG